MEAERHVRNAIVLCEQAGYKPGALNRAVWLGRSYLLVRGAPDWAAQVVDSILQHYPLSDMEPLDRPYLNLAGFYAQAGRVERSKHLLAEYDGAVEPSLRHLTEAERRRTLGELALAEGRPQDALAEFRAYEQTPADEGSWAGWEGCTICALSPLGRAYELAGQADSAIALYERFVAAPDIWSLWEDFLWLAFTYQRLGDLYEQRGDTANAIRHYAKFVDLWKDADPELQPRVEAARRAIDALSRVSR